MILVDAAIWSWRDDRWAHLVSDTSLDELHEFAETIDVRRMAFQGDHYDVPTEVRERALDAGAVSVEGREIVRRLRHAGLRLAPRERPPRWSIRRDVQVDIAALSRHDVPDPLAPAIESVGGSGPVRFLHVERPGAVGIALAGKVHLVERPAGLVTHLTRDGDHQVVELLAGARV